MPEIGQNPYNQYHSPQQFGTYNVPSKGIEEVKTKNRLLGAVTDSVENSEKGDMKTSFLASLLASIGIVKGTNFLLQPKNITDTMTQYDTYTNSRLYRIGQKVDNFGPLRWISNKLGAVKRGLSRIPVPQFVREMGEKWRIGSVAPWDKTGMWTKGKKVEAMNEFLDFLSKSSYKKLNLGRNYDIVKNTLDQFAAKRINPYEAFKKIEPIMRNVNAKDLARISRPTGFFSRLFGVSNDLNLSLAKAQTLAKTSGGAVGKTIGKSTTMLGEASGGGVLGGKFALLLNALFIAQNLNEARKAEDGEKLKTFMDEFFGTTLGSYLMQMYMGEKFNNFLGLAEHGMTLNSAEMQGIINQLKLEDPKRVLDVVGAYNKLVPKNKALSALLDKIGKDSATIGEAGKILSKHGVEIGMKDKALVKLLECIEKGKIAPSGTPCVKGVITPERAVEILRRFGITPSDTSIEAIRNSAGSNLKTSIMNLLQREIKTPEQMETMYKGIKGAMKSNITFGSIFKGTDGNFLTRLGRYIVQKPVAAVTKLLSTGRYTLTDPNAGFLRRLGGRFKRIGGGIGRILLVSMVLVPPIAGLFTKFSHKIFGKPKKKILEEQQAQMQQQEQEKLLQQLQQMQNQPQQVPQGTPTEYVPFSNQSTNLIDMYTGKTNPQNQNGTQAQQNNPAQQNNSAQQAKPSEINKYDSATYVPNQMLTQESFVDPALTQDLLVRRDLALQHADSVEKNARDLLSRL
ncbi:hypothetical protein IJS77_04265 [bacterium]|nr:hypothetical protein [bacterium]